MSFEVKLPLFEGPFDLLLFFIERDELDIYDIPIAKVSNDFLDYLHHLEQMNVDVASEFILVAAKLIQIKAKMLLPRPVLNEEGEEVDPREELIKHLLEYKKYKAVITHFEAMEEEMRKKKKRGNLTEEIKVITESFQVEAELQHVDIYKLFKTYERLLQKHKLLHDKPSHTVVQYPYNMARQKSMILDMLDTDTKISFEHIMTTDRHKIAVIFNFLAILDLVQQKLIKLQIGLGYNNFWIEKVKKALVK